VYPNENVTSSRDIVSSLDTLDKKTVSSTYADILASNRVYQDTLGRLQLESQKLNGVRVYAEVQADTNILVLSVEGPDPQVTTLLANNIGQNGISLIKSLYQVFDISFLDTAVEPQKPFRPQPLRDGLIAAGAGLLLGLIFVLIEDWIRVPFDLLRERSITDKQSLAFSKKYIQRLINQEFASKKVDEPLAFGRIYLAGLEDLLDGLPERVATPLMQKVASDLHLLLRGNDIVGRWDKLEFSLLLPSTPELPALKTFERLVEKLNELVVIDSETNIDLDPVAGLALRKPGDKPEQLYQRAEDALQKARNGREKIVLMK
jgi:GGDEF domain-containing protein